MIHGHGHGTVEDPPLGSRSAPECQVAEFRNFGNRNSEFRNSEVGSQKIKSQFLTCDFASIFIEIRSKMMIFVRNFKFEFKFFLRLPMGLFIDPIGPPIGLLYDPTGPNK